MATLAAPTGMIGRRVRCYMNLNRSKPGYSVFSLQDASTRRVIGYAHQVTLTAGRCMVSAAGRMRAREEKRRNVHAWIEGIVVAIDRPEPTCTRAIRYNPFLFDSFVWEDTETPVETILDYACCDGTRVWVPQQSAATPGTGENPCTIEGWL